MLSRGTLVLLRNSQRDGRKGGKLQKRWIGPYSVSDSLGKGVYKLCNPTNGKNLKKAVNICRLKIYHSKNVKPSHFSNLSCAWPDAAALNCIMAIVLESC